MTPKFMDCACWRARDAAPLPLDVWRANSADAQRPAPGGIHVVLRKKIQFPPTLANER
jgi:hypothetical protein